MPETSPRVQRLLRELPIGGSAALDAFWREVAAQGRPLIEAVNGDSGLVTFLWRGAAARASATWNLDVPLSRVEGTDLWHGSVRLPLDVRTIYYLSHGGDALPIDPDGVGPAHPDPLNPAVMRFPADRSDPNDYSIWMSVLEMPDAPSDEWSRARPGSARGSLLTTSLRTAALGGRRRIGVYRPAGRAESPYALLVVFDGFESRAVLRIPTTLDNLIAAGKIPATLALFVNSPSGGRRDRELRPAQALRTFVERELLPWARRRWNISDRPADRIVAGSSRGGLAAAYLGLVASHVFAGVISQSGSFWWPEPPAPEREWLTRAYETGPRLPLRFYLDVGTLENVDIRGDGLDQVTANRRFRDVLVERGYPVEYVEYAGGHDYINWRRTFADGLVAVLG